MRAHLEERPTPPAEVDPSIPAAYSQAILKALSKDPDERFASADELRSELSQALREPAVAAAPPVESAPAPVALLADRRLQGLVALLLIASAAALLVALWSAPALPTEQTALQQEPLNWTTLPSEPSVETVQRATAAAEPKPSPGQPARSEPPLPEQTPPPVVIAAPGLSTMVQVRILNAFGSDSIGEITAEIVSPPAFTGYRIGGRVIEAKSSGNENRQSDLKIAFTFLDGIAQDTAIASELQGFRNSRGNPGVDENGNEVKIRGGVLQRGKVVASGIGSAVAGLFGRKGNGDRAANAATLTTKAARITFAPGSEFDLYVRQLDSD